VDEALHVMGVGWDDAKSKGGNDGDEMTYVGGDGGEDTKDMHAEGSHLFKL
jgi:hypothetical protein